MTGGREGRERGWVGERAGGREGEWVGEWVGERAGGRERGNVVGRTEEVGGMKAMQQPTAAYKHIYYCTCHDGHK